MAVSLTWQGHVDTDLDFSEFFSHDHTYVLRFMPQFPHAYEGPMIAENGTGMLVIGQGHFAASPSSQTKLLLAVGVMQQVFPATLNAGEWHHLALSVVVGVRDRVFTLFLDGSPLGSPLMVASTGLSLPQGKVRFGKRTSGQTVNGQNAQFYGLLDDVAVFKLALNATQIQSLMATAHLTGNEAGLLAGYNFQTGQPARLARPFTLSGGAEAISVSANRNSVADAGLLPMPTQQQVMDLPFPPGEAWFVIQGNDDPTGSHSGLASFCWDLMIADHSQNGIYPNGSNGAPFYACAPGTVATVQQGGVSGNGNPPNHVEIQQAANEICAYLHLQHNQSQVAVGDHVGMGKKLSLTGDTGVGAGAFHVHVAVTDMLDGTPGFVTFPVAFNDYEVRVGSVWQTVSRGRPSQGDVLRIPPTPQFRPDGFGIHGAVARDANTLDVVATDVTGRCWRAKWIPGAFAKNWDRWRPILNGLSTAHTPVSVVARATTKLDVFVAGSDGHTYTAAWDKDRVNEQWRGWWNILTGAIPSGGTVSGVSRDPGKLDIFLVSNDGGVYTAAWDRDVANQAWRGWWPIGSLVAKPGSPVAVVSRDPNKLDIFVAGSDGKTYTAAWDAQQANGQWRGWWNILTGAIPSGGTVSCVSRDPGKLDIFLVSNDGGVYTAAWEQDVANQTWRGWWRIGNLVAKPGSPVAVVSRDPNKLDIFVAGSDGKTYTAAWDAQQANGQWRGWWNILTGAIVPGSAVAAASRDPGKLDIFIVSTDGAIYTAAWDGNVANGAWQGWWKIGI
jgi:hypothetical protein